MDKPKRKIRYNLEAMEVELKNIQRTIKTYELLLQKERERERELKFYIVNEKLERKQEEQIAKLKLNNTNVN
jgi:hypothetical protein